MGLKLVSDTSKQLIKQASTKHDNLIEKVCKGIEDSDENLRYEDVKVPLLVKKPWGEETLIGLSENVELWELVIESGSQTSFHCHPNKDTLLVIVSGEAGLRTEDGYETMRTGAFRLLEKKTPHQLRNVGEDPLLLIEIESPANKNDLVRIEDSYGREGKAYLHKSSLAKRDRLTELVLLDRDRILMYLEQQEDPEGYESKFPIHVTTNLGMTRELYTPKAILKQFGAVDIGFAATLEIFVPSLETIGEARENQKDEYNKFIAQLDDTAQERSGGRLRANARDIHGSVWDEVFIVLKGELTFVEFEPTEKEKGIMRQNGGSVYELDSVDTVREWGFNKLSVKQMKKGDVFFSPAGTAHGVFDADDALYLVFINKSKDFDRWAKEFWGEDSEKYKLNRKIADELKSKDVESVSSYWGEYSKSTK